MDRGRSMMINIDKTQKYINALTKSNLYGGGHISKFELKDDGRYYITVVFDKDNNKRTFLANTVFSKGILSLVNNEYNNEILQLLSQEVPVVKPVTTPVIEKKQTSTSTSSTKHHYYDSGISSNKNNNNLVNRLMNDESIALELISHYEDSQFEKELCEEAFLYLERIMSGVNISETQKACIVCALSLIALKYYDGDLHSYIEAKYREYMPKTEHKYPTYNPIQRGIYDVLFDYRKKTKYFDPHSYVAVPIVLGCVPHYRLPDLFKISYDIYKKKLLYDEDVSDDQINEKVLETFKSLNRKDLISDSDQIKGTNYLMSKYTQSCIYSGYGINALSRIVARCIRLIISYLTRPEDSFRIDPYYLEGYASWVTNFEADDKEKERYEINRTISQPYLKLIDNKVHIFTGEYSMDESYDPNDVHIIINKGEEFIIDLLLTDPNAVEYVDEDSAMSGFIIRRQEISLNMSPLDNLSYQIVCSGQVLYDSKARLYRNCIFFDGKGNEVKPGYSYSGEVFVVSHSSNEEGNVHLTPIYKADDYILSIAEVNDHEVFYFDGEPYTFFKIASAQVISYDTPWGEFVSAEGKKYPIYRDINILFPASCDKEDIYLEIDGQEYLYGDPYDIYYKIRVYSKGYDGWAYTVRVYGLEPGYHNIRIFNDISGKQIKGANFGVVYDPDIWKSYKSNDDKGVEYKLTCNFIKEEEIYYEYGATYKEVHAFVKFLGHGNLAIYPSSICYSEDGESWFDIQDKENRFFLCDIPESTKSIYICGPKGMKAFLLKTGSTVEKQEISFEALEDDPRKYKLYLPLLRSIQDRKKTKVSFEYGNQSRFLEVSYNPFVIIEDCHFYYDEETGKHCFWFCMEGKSKVKAVFKPLHSDEILFEKPVGNGDLVELDDKDIDDKIKYLTISLHGRKYGALFDPYKDEHFMSFPKYDLGRVAVWFKPYPMELVVKNNTLICDFSFSGTSALMAEIKPTGFNTPLTIKTLKEGDIINYNIKGLPFNSYMLFLYSAKNKEGTEFNGIPIFVSQPVKVASPFLQKTLSVSAFILDDGTKLKASYTIWFKTIEEIDHEYYLIVTLKSKTSDKVKENVVCSIKKTVGLTYEAEIRLKEGDTLTKMGLNNGKTVNGIVIEQIGAWS